GKLPCTLANGTLELLGVGLAIVAWICSLTTILMPSWITLSTDLLPTEETNMGLWVTCVSQEATDKLECRPYDSMFELPPDIILARILMSLVLGVGLLGVLLAIPGIRLVNGCQNHLDDFSCKRALKAIGGALCLVTGILGLIPVSYVAHLTLVRFFDETVPQIVPRWEFGYALFCGWIAGILHLVAGTLLLISCLHFQKGLIRPCNVTWMYRQTNTDYCDIDGNKTEIIGKYAHK
uniref:Claudin n=1 Tax=Haplochromis burtoni TaxID=8153 RepID=A0A3Q2WF74_HAPBU